MTIGVLVGLVRLGTISEEEAISEAIYPEATPTPIREINPYTGPPEPGPKFLPGDKVIVTANMDLVVRDAAAGKYIGQKRPGTWGIIIGGPKPGEIEGKTYDWWEIVWEDEKKGWSAEGEPAGDGLAEIWLELEELQIEKPDPEEGCGFGRLFPTDTMQRTGQYGIFGDDEFDTTVCGYLETREEIVLGAEQTNAYFIIVNFEDEGFIRSIAEGIRSGNEVNTRIDGHYALNLGCFEDRKIVGVEYEEKPYFDPETHEKILNSSPDNLVSLVLSFGKHTGTDYHCANLAHTIRLYESY